MSLSFSKFHIFIEIKNSRKAVAIRGINPEWLGVATPRFWARWVVGVSGGSWGTGVMDGSRNTIISYHVHCTGSMFKRGDF